jgi:hypothetical protein
MAATLNHARAARLPPEATAKRPDATQSGLGKAAKLAGSVGMAATAKAGGKRRTVVAPGNPAPGTQPET